jgi:transposase
MHRRAFSERKEAIVISAVIERCAGIDVGKKFVVVCVMTGPASGEAQEQMRKFGTVRAELARLREWLKAEGCTHVVMESTGCYWKPVLNVLEDDPEYSVVVVLANAQQVKAITGHKTDPHDARWLAHLLRHGMIRPSFIPRRAIRDLRDFTRRRKQVIAAAAQERNRVQKVLEDANVKIGDVLSDVFGLSGQLMLEALLNGEKNHLEVAKLARGHARKKIAELAAALEGHHMRDTHRVLIRHALEHMAFLAHEVESLDEEIEKLIGRAELTEQYEMLQTIPGIRETAAAAILAESGGDMKQFPTPAKLSSWSGVAPGNNESAGKKKYAPTLKGNPHMKVALIESAWSASRTHHTEFKDHYDRLKGRIGHKRAIVADGHLLAIRIYEVLASGRPYESRKPEYKCRDVKRLVRHHTRRLNTWSRWLKPEVID